MSRESRFSLDVLSACWKSAALLLLSTTAAATDRAHALGELLARYHELGQFNGAVLVAEEDRVLLRNGYGVADPGARFLVGSISKSFTAHVILQLVDEGVLELQNTVADYLPYYRQDTGSQITLQHLLTHRDGLTNYTNNPEFWQPDSADVVRATRDYVQVYCSSDLQFEPGSEYRYGNSAYSILGAIIEEVSGKPFAAVLQSRLIEPLGLNDSGDSHPPTPTLQLEPGYQIGPDGYRLAEPVYKPLFAAGSLFSTVDDLFAYIESMDLERLARNVSRDNPGGRFVYGWSVGELELASSQEAVRIISTNGEVNGYNALLIRTIESQQTIILLSNTGETDLASMAGNILQILGGGAAQRPMPRTRDGFYQTLQQDGVDAAIVFYREQRSKDPDDYIYFRWPLRILAQQLLDDGRQEDAMKILALNLETHPGDARSEQMLKALRD